MRCLAIAFLLLVAVTAHSASLTLGQQGMLRDVLQDDLTAYLEGGNSMFNDDWTMMAVPWTEDKDIGLRYSRGAVAADDFYADKVIFINGHFYGAENWIGDTYRVQMWLVAAIVNKENSAFLKDATQGRPIKLACQAQGQELEYVYLNHCEGLADATATLVSWELKLITNRMNATDKKAIKLAIVADAKIARDDPCRNTMGGCIDDIRALLH